MQRIKLPQIQGHYLTLTLKSPILTLEIEEESSGRIFSLDLDEDSVDQVTDGLFQTAQDFFRGLQDAANQTCPGITLTLSQGKLIYTVVFSIEAVQKYSFILNLAEKRMDHVELLERKLRILEQWKERQEAETQKCRESLQSLQEENEKMTQRLSPLENPQRIEILERQYDNLKFLLPEKPDAYFNHDSVNASRFFITDNSKTATPIHGSNHGLEILPHIPLGGQYSYSLRINKTINGSIVFGVTHKGEDWLNDQSYVFFAHNGKIVGRMVIEPIEKGPFGQKDMIIKMIVDMDRGTLTFFVDNKQVNFCDISKSEKYSAFVGFGFPEDSVTLL